MYLTHLSLTNYRAFSRLDTDLPRRILLLVGDNAQGKTSLLEAIYFLATFNSFQAQSDRQLVNFLVSKESLAVTRLVADYHRSNKNHRLEVRLIQESAGNGNLRLRKEILVDGVKRSIHEAMGHFTAVIFLPQMIRILENGPDERRRYLNLALSQAMAGYSQALSDYGAALSQRNALLKQLAERGGDPDQLDYWDGIISQRGAFIIHARIAAVQQLEKQAARIHHKLTHSQEVLRLDYQPAYDPKPPPQGQYTLPIQTTVLRDGITLEQIQEGFARQLLIARSDDIARGVTTLGPHRDELRFLSNGIDLGDYGSRGQARTALLSLKLAEVNWLKERTGQWPVLLLDEILVELDIQRRADLLNYLGDYEQALLTTTDLKLFAPEFVETCTVWKVESGQVTTG
jgi:DNA replication and repair protein RecF